jgi:hypothetical protein
MKKLFTFLVLSLVFTTIKAQLIKNDFLSGYSVNDVLEKGTYSGTDQTLVTIMQNQWNLAGKTGANDQSGANPVVADPLYYTGYAESGKDVSINLAKLSTGGRTTIYSLASDNAYGNTSGGASTTYYLTFMFNLSTASTTSAAEFLSFDGNFTGNAQRARFTVKGIDANTYQIGMGDSGAASTFGTSVLNFNQTYLGVIKLTIDGTGTGNCWAYINPTLGTSDPPASYESTSAVTGTALKAIRGIVIRQRSTLAGQLGGFRLTSTWGMGAATPVETVIKDSPAVYFTDGTIVTPGKGTVVVFNSLGAPVWNVVTDGVCTPVLEKGIYVIRFTAADGTVLTKKIVIR